MIRREGPNVAQIEMLGIWATAGQGLRRKTDDFLKLTMWRNLS